MRDDELRRALGEALKPELPDPPFRDALRARLVREAALVGAASGSRARVRRAAAARAGAVAAAVALLVGGTTFAMLANRDLARAEEQRLVAQGRAMARAIVQPPSAFDIGRVAEWPEMFGVGGGRLLLPHELAATAAERERLRGGEVVSRLSVAERRQVLVPLPGRGEAALQIEAAGPSARQRAAGLLRTYVWSFLAGMLPAAGAGWWTYRRAASAAGP